MDFGISHGNFAVGTGWECLAAGGGGQPERRADG
jgi:hypothetical protein